MTTRALRIDIDPILPPPRWRIGLYENSGAQQLPQEAIDRLAGGIAYQSLDPSIDRAEASFDPCDTYAAEFETSEILEWNGWGISQGSRCSTLTGSDGELAAQEERAEALLAAKTSHLIEYTFWTGEVSSDTFATLTWPNVALSDAGAVDLTPSDGEAGPVEAFGLINEYLADTLQGLRGVIHVSPQLLPYLSYYDLVVRDGFTLGTALGDHLVIAGSGYTGSGLGNTPQPDNRAYIYATSMVRVGASPIETRSAYDRALNKATAIAYRHVLAEFDQNAHAAVRVCLTDPGPTCAAEGS